MHIYLDESGGFQPLNGKPPKASAVGALVIPSSTRQACVKAYKTLRKRLRPGAKEMKGSTLSERESAAVLSTLASFGLLFYPVLVDGSRHSQEGLNQFRDQQADLLLADLSREHDANTVHSVCNLRSGLRRLSPQLFTQCYCYQDVIERTMELSTLYYSQRRPAELSSFTWTVDSKDTSITLMEETWSELLLPMLYTRSLTKPMSLMPGADYSAFERFKIPLPNPDGSLSGESGTDLRQVIADSLRFLPSEDDLGLQIADNFVSILTRALNGKLQPSGWSGLSRYLVYHKGGTLRMVQLSPNQAAKDQTFNFPPYWDQVATALAQDSLGMVTQATARKFPKSGA